MDWREELSTLLPRERFTMNATELDRHSRDESYHTPHAPDVVCFPESKEEVSRILRFAHERRIPVVPFGAGSSLEGHTIPYKGGISLDMTRMNRILQVYPEDFLVRAEPGVTRTQLNKELKKYGLFFSVDPGADATLGGMAATNASGTTAVRYGVMRDQVKGLEVVLADGRILRTGGSYVKSAAGYSLTGLFVGSEGTLGVFTELLLRVYGLPEAIVAARVSFPTVQEAVATANALMQAGIPIARVELLDAESIRQINREHESHYEEAPTLFLEFHGNEAGLAQDLRFAQELSAENRAGSFFFEKEEEARAKLWEARHHLAYSFIHGYPGRKMMLTDVALPLSELAGAVELARKLLDQYGIPGGVLGHIGDGNFHTVMMVDVEDEEEMRRAEEMHALLTEYALDKGGTCTGEHGIGVGKIRYMRREHGEGVELMRAIKRAFDPENILNPGKIFPQEEGGR
ncbi:MAG: FAD-binding protein [Thermicanus sp.]|nr:FAD-binding protein [Thermicanus sp.]